MAGRTRPEGGNCERPDDPVAQSCRRIFSYRLNQTRLSHAEHDGVVLFGASRPCDDVGVQMRDRRAGVGCIAKAHDKSRSFDGSFFDRESDEAL